MSTQTERTMFRKVFEPLPAAPRVFLAYIAFAVLVTFSDFIVLRLVPDSFRAQLVPYTGWLASMFYAFTIFFACALVYRRQKRRTVRLAGITLQLVLSIVFGMLQMLQIGRETFNNLYLTISPWRAVWTIVIPCLWIPALYSPAMNRFCQQQEKTAL